jgi:hypothetical protein
MDALSKALGIMKDFGIFILAAVILIIFLSYRSETKDMLQARHNYEMQQFLQMQQLTTALGQLALANDNLATKMTQREEKAQAIKIDLGKSIRTFNRTIKEIKNVQTAKESIDSLHAAWDWSAD